MVDESELSFETHNFENGEKMMLEVDGEVVLCIEQVEEALLSRVDDAAIAVALEALGETVAEGVEEETDEAYEELLRRHEPAIRMGDDEEGWEEIA